MSDAIPSDAPDGLEDEFTTYRPEHLEEWERWKGEGDPPVKWWAVDPVTRQSVLVYRSFADFVRD